MNETTFRLTDFGGGLNKKAANHVLAERECPECLNVNFTGGAIEKRGGAVLVGTPPADVGAVTGLYRFYRSGGDKFTLATAGANLYQYNTVTGAWDILSGTLSAGAVPSWETWKDLCFLNNGVNFKKYDGTTVSDVVNYTDKTHVTVHATRVAPKGLFLCEHLNRLFVGHVLNDGDGTAAKSRVRFSELNDPEVWPSDNFVDVATDDGSAITGIVSRMGILYIFKENSIWALYGSTKNTFSLVKVSPTVGCLIPGSLAVAGRAVLFWSRRGIEAFDGGNVELLSDRVSPLLETVNWVQTAKVRSIAHNDRYWLAFPTGSSVTNDTILVYDLRENWWTRYAGLTLGAFAVLDGSGDSGELCGGNGAVTKVYELAKGVTDDGAAISAYWSSKHFDFGSPQVVKTFRRLGLDVLSNGGVTRLQYDIDVGKQTGELVATLQGAGKSLWGQFIWGVDVWSSPTIQLHQKSLPQEDTGAFIRFVVNHDDTSSGMTVRGINLQLRPKRERW